MQNLYIYIYIHIHTLLSFMIMVCLILLWIDVQYFCKDIPMTTAAPCGLAQSYPLA
jgi:hypothetical protein